MEIILRVFGSGYPTAFLLPTQHRGQAVYVQNNKFGWRFFGPELSRNPNPFLIRKEKSPDTIRIFVFGESAAKGDPDPHFGVARTLEATLNLRHPGMHFEVINTAITAINSHAILPIARDCARANGDLWVIYMGNNEVVGPFGAGTVFGAQSAPLPLIRSILSLKTTRSGQWLDSLLNPLKAPAADSTDWRGMEMFLDQRVRSDDPRLAGVYHHFEHNLRDILRAGNQSKVGIVLSTVAVNLKDCAPFGSAHRADLSESELAHWNLAYEQGIKAQSAGVLAAAVGHFRQAAEIDGSYAELQFRLAQCALAAGNSREAQEHFAAARDLDTLRFRCDSRLNDVIRTLATEWKSQRVLLADAEQALAEHSPDATPGENYFYEHVHLNFAGNCLLARTMAEQIEKLLPDRLTPSAPTNQAWPTPTECAQSLGWSEYSRFMGWKLIAPRLNRPPFTGQFDHQIQFEKWQAQQNQLSLATRPDGLAAALRACNAALAEAPADSDLLFQRAHLQGLTGDIPGAIATARQALEELPSDAEGWLQLGRLLARTKQFDDAVSAFQQAVRLDPGNVVAQDGLGQCLAAAGRMETATRVFRSLLEQKPQLGLVWLHLGQLLAKQGQTEEAETCFEKAATHPGSNLAGWLELAGYCQSRGWFERAAKLYVAALKQDSANPQLHVGASQNYVAIGQLDEASQHAVQAIALAPEFAEAHLLYGTILGKRGEILPAREEFQAALRINPNLLDARMNLGIALLAEQPAAALAEFQEVLRLSPSHPAALKYVAELQRRAAGGVPRD